MEKPRCERGFCSFGTAVLLLQCNEFAYQLRIVGFVQAVDLFVVLVDL